jgi:serine/threonine protein phosphatase PrpC
MAVDCKHPKQGVEVASLTDVGLLRTNNEDSFLYWEPDSEDAFARKGRLAIVADGMGGYEGGQEASRIAVETVQHLYDTAFEGDPQQALVDAFDAAHAKIQVYGLEHPEFSGMGTTCTALAIVDHHLYFAHVGDSRLYLVRDGSASKLTRDHSYVGRLVEAGLVRPEDAESHPQRHILTAALGSGQDVIPDIAQHAIPIQTGDILILCSDGLWGLVSDRELASAVSSNPPAEACSALVKMALDRGGPDNITVLILKISG